MVRPSSWASTAFPTSTRCIPADITARCNFVRSTCLRSVAKISEPCRSPCVRPIWSGFSAADQTGSLSTRLKLARSGQTYSSRLPYRVGRCQPASQNFASRMTVTLRESSYKGKCGACCSCRFQPGAVSSFHQLLNSISLLFGGGIHRKSGRATPVMTSTFENVSDRSRYFCKGNAYGFRMLVQEGWSLELD